MIILSYEVSTIRGQGQIVFEVATNSWRNLSWDSWLIRLREN